MSQTVSVACGNELLKCEVESGLVKHGITISSCAMNTVMLDTPYGWVENREKKFDFPSAFVLSTNPCSEYLLDIVEQKPLALLQQPTLKSIAEAIDCKSTPLPKISSSLTPTERCVLRLIARGAHHKEIASARNIAVTRVRNIVQVVYQKTGLNSGTQLALYYFGLWHVLYESGWLPPRCHK